MDVAKGNGTNVLRRGRRLHPCPRAAATLRAPYRDQSSDSIAAPAARRGFIGALRTPLSKVWNFCCDFRRLWLGDRPRSEYQLENHRCVSQTNGTRLVLCWLSRQPCEWG